MGDVFNSLFFREFVNPQEANVEGFRRVLVIAPHSDDESIGCGGLLDKVKDHCEIIVIFITDSFQSDLQNIYRDIVQVRKLEGLSACDIIGAESLFMKLPNEENFLTNENASRLALEINRFNPDLILTPWLFDKPVKHRVVNVLLCLAFKKLNLDSSIPIWGYQVHNIPLANVVINITNHIKSKLEMIRCHKSQLNSISRYDYFMEGMNRWNFQFIDTKEQGFAELFSAFPLKEWVSMMDEICKNQLVDYLGAFYTDENKNF